MKKILIAVILVIIVVVGYVALNVDNLIKQAANNQLPKILGVPAKVDAVHTNFLDGKVTLDGLQVGAPRGMQIPYTFQASKISIHMPLAALMNIKKQANIKLISISSPSLYYLITARGNNITRIINNLQSKPSGPRSSSSSSSNQGVANKTHSSQADYKVVIERLLITDINGNIIAFKSKPLTANIGQIELKNIGTVEHSVTIRSAISQVLHELLSKISKQDVNKLLQKSGVNKLQQKAQDKIKSLGDKGVKNLKDLFKH